MTTSQGEGGGQYDESVDGGQCCAQLSPCVSICLCRSKPAGLSQVGKSHLSQAGSRQAGGTGSLRL